LKCRTTAAEGECDRLEGELSENAALLEERERALDDAMDNMEQVY